MGSDDREHSYPKSILGALYEAIIDPRKGLAAAKRDYMFERYISRLEDEDVDEVNLWLTFPDPAKINPLFYAPRFHIEISPHTLETSPDDREFGDEDGYLSAIVERFTPTGWLSGLDRLTTSVYGNKPKHAYEKTSTVYAKWLRNLEDRGFSVSKDYQFPRGLRTEIAEEDRAPW